MCKKHYQNIDNLILNIRIILSEDRCSLSDEEKVQLNNTISYLESSKKIDDNIPIDWSLVVKGFDLLLRVFSNLDDFPDIF
jgi:hypothetical protein